MPKARTNANRLYVYSFRMTQKMYDRLRILSRLSQLSQQELLRRGFEDYLDRELAEYAAEDVEEAASEVAQLPPSPRRATPPPPPAEPKPKSRMRVRAQA